MMSVLQYAPFTDEINTEVQEKDPIIETPDTPTKLTHLLWMDDAHLKQSPKEMKNKWTSQKK